MLFFAASGSLRFSTFCGVCVCVCVLFARLCVFIFFDGWLSWASFVVSGVVACKPFVCRSRRCAICERLLEAAARDSGWSAIDHRHYLACFCEVLLALIPSPCFFSH